MEPLSNGNARSILLKIPVSRAYPEMDPLVHDETQASVIFEVENCWAR